MTEKLRIKICGMRDRDNVADVAALHPDFMGLYSIPPLHATVSVSIPRL